MARRSSSPAHAVVAPSSPLARSPRRRRGLLAVGGVLLVLLILLIVWLILLALQAHRIAGAAHSLESSVTGVRTGLRDPSTAAAAAAVLQHDLRTVQARSATLHDDTTGWVWSSGRYFPGLSSAVDQTGDIATTAQDLSTQVLPAYVTLAGQAGQLRSSDGDVNIPVLQRNAGPVIAAANRLTALTTALAAKSDTGIRPLDNGRAQLVSAMQQLQGYAQPAAITLDVAPTLLGADKPTTTLVILESPAEARAGGGLVGGYVLLRADHGHVSVAASGTNHELANAPKPVISLGSQYDDIYTNFSARNIWIQSNLSPDFPATAQIWAALFHRQYGITPDAELAVTPSVLDKFLAVSGPVTLPDGTTVKAGQANQLLQVGLYQRFPTAAQETQRNAFQLQFLRSTLTALLADHADTVQLLRSLGPSVDAGALRLHVTAGAPQQLVASTPLAGALGTAAGPFLGTFVDNADATKLDAYLKKSVTYSRGDVANGLQTVQATVTLTNTAPTSGLPSYVTTRHDTTATTVPGSHVVLLAVYLATDASRPTVTVNGKLVTPADITHEQNHLLVLVFPPALAPGGGKAVVTVTATEPGSDAAPAQLRQPLLIPETTTIQPPGS